jgi:sugar/nucleoside kinase (ribokinase family)
VASTRKKVGLVIGELCLDVHVAVPRRGDSVSPLMSGFDASMQADITVKPGGTALLFADALISSSDVLPLIVGVIGDDWAGELLARSLSARGFPAEGILRITDAHTDVVVTASFRGAARLMIWPRNKASTSIHASIWRLASGLTNSYDICFAWISGYVLESNDTSRAEAMKRLCSDLRERGVPVAVDLVPHDFATRVGSLTDLEQRIGPIDVIVGEFVTLLDLGFGQRPATADSVRSAMITCVRSAAFGRIGAVVQHRISDGLYCQAIAIRGMGESTTDMPIPAEGPRGVGDHLAVRALKEFGLVS